jgi:hypothetical protein
MPLQESATIEGGKPTHCVACKMDGMVDMKNKKCHCGKAPPSFGVEGGEPTTA